jgi:hypothetical protein
LNPLMACRPPAHRHSMAMCDDRHRGTGTIKVLIAEVPALLAAVVRQVVNEESDMTVVEQVSTLEELRKALHRPVDVVVTSSPTTALGPQYPEGCGN